MDVEAIINATIYATITQIAFNIASTVERFSGLSRARYPALIPGRGF